jgi:ATP-dependent RNA helicase RhlE
MQKKLDSDTPSFHHLGIAPQILNHLDRLKYTVPTPIQQEAIPLGLEDRDIIGIAQTGTGKTLAFGIPMLQRFLTVRHRGRGLILLPTRELALQVDETLQKIGAPFKLRTAVLIGGAPMKPQQSQLRADPDIIVATPGRLIDHLQNRFVDLRAVDTLVLDEADRMLDMGFLPQIKQILRGVPDERQTMLFSATMPEAITQIAQDYMIEPVRVEVARAGTGAEQVTHELFVVAQEAKNDLLQELLRQYHGTILVFARTRSRANRVARHIRNLGHKASEIHADRTLTQRRAALDGFKNGTYRILVATDIAARGIDVSNIELVINYDLPDCAEDYVHRIGRTGRAGKSGHAIAFAAPDQGGDVRQIEKLMQIELPLSPDSPGKFSAYAAPQSSRQRRPSQHRHEQDRRQRRTNVTSAPQKAGNAPSAAPSGAAVAQRTTRPSSSTHQSQPAGARSSRRGQKWTGKK